MDPPNDPQQPEQTSPPPPRPPVDPVGAIGHPAPPSGYAPPPYAPPRGGRVGKIFGWSASSILITLLMISIGFNVYLAMFFNTVTGGPHEVTYEAGTDPGRIVILPIVGLIDGDKNGFIRRSLRRLREKRPLAVVLRVESGGGYVGPSDRILRQLKQFRKETDIPIVASFGSLAASGGYYVSASCDWILAEPTCMTGSIGVMSGTFTVERLLERIGVTPEVRTAADSPEKDIANNPFRSWTPRDRQKQQMLLDNAHARFVEVVHEGRKKFLSKEQTHALANGDTYTTDQALENKLVDSEGYIEDAIEKAKELASLSPSDDPEITIMRAPVDLGILNLIRGQRTSALNIDAENLRRTLLELQVPRLMYR